MLLERLLKKGREDTCTETLLYLLNNDDASNRNFISKLISNSDYLGDHQYLGQWTTQKTIRTSKDTLAYIDAYYDSLDLVIAIESKFGAGFTNNQPHEYLNHLKGEVTKGKQCILVLMAPAIRKNELLLKVIKRTKHKSYQVTVTVDGQYICNEKMVSFDFLSWDDACELLIPSSQPELYIKDELDSLIMTEIGDQTPFTSSEFSPSIAQTTRRLISLVKKIASDLNSHGVKVVINKSETYFGLNFVKHGKNYWFGYSSYAWSNFTDTPLVFKIESKKLRHIFKDKYSDSIRGNHSEYIPFDIPCDVSLDEAASGCTNNILKILSYIDTI
ncbi:MAG: PD-(D/E)XK nuclease family protein [Colwellia sp.]